MLQYRGGYYEEKKIINIMYFIIIIVLLICGFTKSQIIKIRRNKIKSQTIYIYVENVEGIAKEVNNRKELINAIDEIYYKDIPPEIMNEMKEYVIEGNVQLGVDYLQLDLTVCALKYDEILNMYGDNFFTDKYIYIHSRDTDTLESFKNVQKITFYEISRDLENKINDYWDINKEISRNCRAQYKYFYYIAGVMILYNVFYYKILFR